MFYHAWLGINFFKTSSNKSQFMVVSKRQQQQPEIPIQNQKTLMKISQDAWHRIRLCTSSIISSTSFFHRFCSEHKILQKFVTWRSNCNSQKYDIATFQHSQHNQTLCISLPHPQNDNSRTLKGKASWHQSLNTQKVQMDSAKADLKNMNAK